MEAVARALDKRTVAFLSAVLLWGAVLLATAFLLGPSVSYAVYGPCHDVIACNVANPPLPLKAIGSILILGWLFFAFPWIGISFAYQAVRWFSDRYA